jgi:hypothetical protein
LCRQIYGPKHAAVIFGWVFASHQVGAAVAATAAGAARTQFGDYMPAWMVAGGLSLLAAVLSLRIARPVRAVTDPIRPAAAAAGRVARIGHNRSAPAYLPRMTRSSSARRSAPAALASTVEATHEEVPA